MLSSFASILFNRPIFVGTALALVVILLYIIMYSPSSSAMWEAVKAHVLERLRALLGMGARHHPIGSKRKKTRRHERGRTVACAADHDPVDDDEWDQSAETAS
jgi:hypothetical protein